MREQFKNFKMLSDLMSDFDMRAEEEGKFDQCNLINKLWLRMYIAYRQKGIVQ